jgi:hypothetical protein
VRMEVWDGALSWWSSVGTNLATTRCMPNYFDRTLWHVSHNQFPPPQQRREWSNFDPDRRALEIVQQALNQACHWNTRVRLKIWSPQACWIIVRVSVALSQDWHKIWCIITVPFSDPSWKSPPVMYTTPNKCMWKLPTSTQLHATWHTDSLDMVVLQSTTASHYHNCCIDSGTSLEYFWYNLVCM